MHSFAPLSNLNFFVKNCWNFCWFFKEFLQILPEFCWIFCWILLNFHQIFSGFSQTTVTFWNFQKMLQNRKFLWKMKQGWSFFGGGMYVLAPGDPSPPSTSNFIPELPRFRKPRAILKIQRIKRICSLIVPRAELMAQWGWYVGSGRLTNYTSLHIYTRWHCLFFS